MRALAAVAVILVAGCAASGPGPDAPPEPAASPQSPNLTTTRWQDGIGTTWSQATHVVVAATWYNLTLAEGTRTVQGNQGEHCGNWRQPGEPLRMHLRGPDEKPQPNLVWRNWTRQPQVTWTDSADSLTQLDFAPNGSRVPLQATFWPFHTLANVTFDGGTATMDGQPLPWQREFAYESRDRTHGDSHSVGVREWLRVESLGIQDVTFVQADICI